MSAHRLDFAPDERRADPQVFMAGWNRTFSCSSIEEPSSTANARVEIWAAQPGLFLKSQSHCQLVSQEDRAELGLITASSTREIAIATRIALRLALSSVSKCAVPASAWRFSRSADTKPKLADGFPQLHFSVSHCSSMIVAAVSDCLPLGIDVESMDQQLSEHLCEHFLSPCERADLSGLSPSQQTRERLRLWTLKEAFSKLVGAGVTLDFASIEFSLSPTRLRQPGPKSVQLHTYFETIYLPAANDLCVASLAVGANTLSTLKGHIYLLNPFEKR